MAYWLCKSDPDEYSWADLVKDGETDWTGVRNHLARKYLLAMRPGDHVLFYHTGGESAVVGIARVVSEAYPDPTADDPRWVAVRLKAIKPLRQPVPLQEIKKVPHLKNMLLVRMGRLSVQPVSEEEFTAILRMGNTSLR
ncbi:MAG: EVE domain-containing protein [Chitinophagales bacterium]|nr:EVE domain-containing protein [Chitinophagales bacterium]MDW8428175.1 EVE domain-containing protein [Chitinophagales bacterium]